MINTNNRKMILMNIYIVMKRVKAINICAQREREWAWYVP